MLADGEIAAHHELGAKEQDRGDHELVDQLDCLARRIAEAHHPEAGRHVAG